jgi:hypothetical protein
MSTVMRTVAGADTEPAKRIRFDTLIVKARNAKHFPSIPV